MTFGMEKHFCQVLSLFEFVASDVLLIQPSKANNFTKLEVNFKISFYGTPRLILGPLSTSPLLAV